MKKSLPAIAILMAFCLSPGARCGEAALPKINLLCTTFPIRQLVKNVVDGVDGIRVEILIPSDLGCPHDYALTPAEMGKLTAADVLVTNGLGMEEFLDDRAIRLNPEIKLIDSSDGIGNLLTYGRGGSEERGRTEDRDGDGHEHGEDDINPHLYASPALSAKLADNIAAALGKIDRANAERYAANAGRYRENMERLARETRELGSRLANRRIVQPHGVFDYLARDLGLEMVGTLQPHGGELSAADMRELLDIIGKERPGALFSEPQYPDKAGRTMSSETGIGLFVLDPASAGPDDAPLDHFEKVMRKNLETIAAALGEK